MAKNAASDGDGGGSEGAGDLHGHKRCKAHASDDESGFAERAFFER